MTTTGALAGLLAGLLLGPFAARLLTSSLDRGPLRAPWRPVVRAEPVPVRDRVLLAGLCALGAGLAGAGAGWTAAWPAFVLVGVVAAPLAVVDLRTHRLPHRLVIPTALATVVLLGLAAVVRGDAGPWWQALLAAGTTLLVLGLVALVRPREFGLGDATTAALLALPLGWRSAATVVLGLWAGFLVAGLVALVLVASRRVGWRSHVPLGPSLLAGSLLTLAATGVASGLGD